MSQALVVYLHVNAQNSVPHTPHISLELMQTKHCNNNNKPPLKDVFKSSTKNKHYLKLVYLRCDGSSCCKQYYKQFTKLLNRLIPFGGVESFNAFRKHSDTQKQMQILTYYRRFQFILTVDFFFYFKHNSELVTHLK